MPTVGNDVQNLYFSHMFDAMLNKVPTDLVSLHVHRSHLKEPSKCQNHAVSSALNYILCYDSAQ